MTEVDTFRAQTRATKYQQKFTLPPNFADVLKDFTREVLRQQPNDIYEWSSNYFKGKALAEDGVDVQARACPSEGLPKEFVEISMSLSGAFGEYDQQKSGKLFPHLMKRVLAESTGLTKTQALLVLSNPGINMVPDGTFEYQQVAESPAVLQQISYLQITGQDFPYPSDDPSVHGMTHEELQAELGSVFKSIDTNATGHLTISQFCKALRSCPLQLSERDINLLILEAPLNGDGNVVWEKLLQEAFHLLCLAHSFTALEQIQ